MKLLDNSYYRRKGSATFVWRSMQYLLFLLSENGGGAPISLMSYIIVTKAVSVVQMNISMTNWDV
jgi:hypothetical protein